jgi:hypothetical protein
MYVCLSPKYRRLPLFSEAHAPFPCPHSPVDAAFQAREEQAGIQEEAASGGGAEGGTRVNRYPSIRPPHVKGEEVRAIEHMIQGLRAVDALNLKLDPGRLMVDVKMMGHLSIVMIWDGSGDMQL